MLRASGSWCYTVVQSLLRVGCCALLPAAYLSLQGRCCCRHAVPTPHYLTLARQRVLLPSSRTPVLLLHAPSLAHRLQGAHVPLQPTAGAGRGIITKRANR